MPGGVAPRFAIEAGFLILLGVAAGYADLRAVVVVALVAGGWLLVSLVEAAVWYGRERPAPPAPPAEGPLPAEPEPAPGWPDEQAYAPAYPLRADAGTEPSEELEAYTRVLERDAEEGEAAAGPEPPAGQE